jgi:eukaryotic-like serine/threonine-protein kinase
VLPKRIGRYEVLGQLAAGGMAEILLARISGPADFKRAVVLKRILRGYAAKEAFVKMFLDEARIVASLQHPNVVHVQELGEHEGDPYLVMEYVAGENASSLLKRAFASGEGLDPRLAAHLVSDVCAGLHAAHELTDDTGLPQNLVHRDVSPQNILVAYDGHVKLVDFGVVLVDRRDARTEPGEVKGKFDYMSPEQMLAKPLDRRSDIFSLGIVLYELSTGRRLFKRASHARTIEAITREPIVPPSRVLSPSAPPYPPKLEAIVMRALSKEATDRYATAAEMRKELLEIARELPSPVEALADRMRRLFPDRIAEKEDMLRKVGAGDELSHVPAGETDDTVEIPSAPDHTEVIDPRAPAHSSAHGSLQSPTGPPFPPMSHRGPAAHAPNSVPPPALTREPSAGSSAVAILAGAALAVAAVFVVLVLVFRTPRQPAATTNEPADPATSSTAPLGSSPPSGSPSAVVVHVDTKPSGARVVVAGEDRGETPLDLHVTRGAAPMSVEVRRQGYVTIAQTVTPDADQKVLIALTPVPNRGRPAARPTKQPASPPTTTTTAAPPPTVRPAPAPAASPTASFHRFD